MKFLPGILLFLMFAVQSHGQVITGKVVDSSNGDPMEYVSIGVVGTSFGTITNGKGEFQLEVKGQPSKAIVRISMIGFKAQQFSLGDISDKEHIIKLVNEPIGLPEVIVRPFSGKLKKAGTMDFTKPGQVCGWSG